MYHNTNQANTMTTARNKEKSYTDTSAAEKTIEIDMPELVLESLSFSECSEGLEIYAELVEKKKKKKYKKIKKIKKTKRIKSFPGIPDDWHETV